MSSVPMSSVDDDTEKVKRRRRTQKKEEVMSLDYDACAASEEKVQRRIQNKEKVSSLKKKVNRPRKKDKKKSPNLYSIPDDLKIPSMHLPQLEELLPAMAKAFDEKDWSLLEKYCFSMHPSLVNEEALKHELVAMCVCFLLIDVPTCVKEGVSWALKSLSSKDPVDTDVPVYQATNVPIDQAFIDALLVKVMCSNNVEVLRQVCWTLAFLARQYLLVDVGTRVQSRLLHHVRIFDTHEVIAPALGAISSIAMVNKGMYEKLVQAVLSDSTWLLNYMRDSHESLSTEAFWTVASICHGDCSKELWEELKRLIPAIVEGSASTNNIDMMQATAAALCGATAGASPDRIKVLVELGCLRKMHECLIFDEEYTSRHCMCGIENILIAGQGVGSNSREENEYAKMIDGYELGWYVFDVDESVCGGTDILLKSYNLVRKYGPHNLDSDFEYNLVRKHGPHKLDSDFEFHLSFSDSE